MILKHCVKIAVLPILLITVSGCSTDIAKAIDEQISSLVGAECSATNLSAGKGYCQEREVAYSQQPVYCYKSLGGVTCYDKENPYNTEHSKRVRKVLALGSNGSVSSQKDGMPKTVVAEQKPAE